MTKSRRKIFIGILTVGLLILPLLTGCRAPKDELDPKKPIALTMWHVFGSQTASPMNDMIEEFNSGVGKDKGVTINVTSISNSSDIHDALLAAARGDAGAGSLPDLFFCYPETAKTIGPERVVAWNELFSQAELDQYITAFLEEGTADGKLLVFPVAKSSEALFVNTTIFQRFAADTGVSYDHLLTWEGLFEAAAQYYEWSGGKTFVMHDELLNYCQINATALGAEPFKDGRLDWAEPIFRTQWIALAKAALSGYLRIEDNYETVCMMTGDIVAGIGSTASIMYFQDTVTYPDNTTEPLIIKALPCPVISGGTKLAMQQGTGLAASVKGDVRKEKAALLFAKWITEGETNLRFVTQSGYMPVQNSAFEAIEDFDFSCESYHSLYTALDVMGNEYQFYLPPVVDGYYELLWAFYDNSLEILTDYQIRYAAGEASLDELAAETYEAMRDALN